VNGEFIASHRDELAVRGTLGIVDIVAFYACEQKGTLGE
jgi:hypothetical protein